MKAIDLFKRTLSGLTFFLKSPEAQVIEKSVKLSRQAQVGIAAVEVADAVLNQADSGPESPSGPRSKSKAASPLADEE